jgi:hypothetical protein
MKHIRGTVRKIPVAVYVACCLTCGFIQETMQKTRAGGVDVMHQLGWNYLPPIPGQRGGKWGWRCRVCTQDHEKRRRKVLGLSE